MITSGPIYRTVVEQSPLSTIVLRPDGSVLWVNQAYQDMWGIHGKALEDLFANYNMLEDPALEAEGVHEYIQRGFRGETVEIPVIHYRPLEGSSSDVGLDPRWCKAFIYPLRNAAGKIQEVVLVHQDVTERVEAEQAHRVLTDRLHRAQRLQAVGQLAGGVAHDFNNLLTILACHAEFASDPEFREHSLQTIRETIASAASLTRRFIALGVGTGVRGAKQPEEISTVVRDTTETLSRTLGENIRLEFASAPDELWIHADTSAVQQAIVNLCINARDAMPTGGCIRLEVVASPSTAELRVVDDGCGMSEEVRLRAFEPFFTTKELGRGTGLGLVMARETMEEHGGSVRLETQEGVGTTVTLSFPRIEPYQSKQSEARAMDCTGRNERVLLVDDDQEVRAALTTVLRVGGYRVTAAADGQEALELFRMQAEDFALILSDVITPRMSGPALVRAARAVKPDQKAIFISGFFDDKRSEEIRSLAVDLLPKPFSRLTVLEAVRAALDAG